jgi:hypothetical protein
MPVKKKSLNSGMSRQRNMLKLSSVFSLVAFVSFLIFSPIDIFVHMILFGETCLTHCMMHRIIPDLYLLNIIENSLLTTRKLKITIDLIAKCLISGHTFCHSSWEWYHRRLKENTTTIITTKHLVSTRVLILGEKSLVTGAMVSWPTTFLKLWSKLRTWALVYKL